MDKRVMYNDVHVHTFGWESTPEKFVPLIGRWLIKSQQRVETFGDLLQLLGVSDKSALEKYGRFASTIAMTQEEILNKCLGYYYDYDVTVHILTIDLRKMGAGRIKKPYMEQLEEAVEFVRTRRNVRLSVMVDPRADDLEQIKDFMVENHAEITGIKLYPPIGYVVTDERLEPFYELAKDYNWTVTIHGTPFNPVHYRKRRGLDKMLPKDFPFYKKYWSVKKKCSNFTHPYFAAQLAGKYPELNINIAHFTDNPEFRKYIIYALNLFPNLYSDYSYTFNEKVEQEELPKLVSLYPWLGDKLLHGSDYYMTDAENIGNPFVGIERNIGEDLFYRFAVLNPRKFYREV